MTEDQRKQILVETVNTFRAKEWFRDAVVHDSYPTNGAATLEIKVNYIPVFERKDIMAFAQAHGLQELFTTVDKHGNRVE